MSVRTTSPKKVRMSKADRMVSVKVQYNTEEPTETLAEIDTRISERFEILELLTKSAISGESRALIVSGPAGLGKSYSVESALAEWDPAEDNHTIVKGYVRATGIYKLLYQYKDKGQVIVFDDADSVFFDDVSLNILKAVCDTTEKRRVSWMSEGKLVDEESAELIPRNFEFNGTIIFITNYDFDAMIDRGHKLAPHLQALVSRSHYIDLALKTRTDYLVRIRQVVAQGLLDNLTAPQKNDVLQYIEINNHKLRELSLRMVLKLGSLRSSAGADGWERMANVTCCR